MLELNFWPSTAMLWPALSVMVASPWQARQSACARRAMGANAMAKTATPAARTVFRMLDRARIGAAYFILPSSFPRQKRIDCNFPWFRTYKSAAVGEWAAEATLQRCAFEDGAGSDRCHKRGDVDHKYSFQPWPERKATWNTSCSGETSISPFSGGQKMGVG